MSSVKGDTRTRRFHKCSHFLPWNYLLEYYFITPVHRIDTLLVKKILCSVKAQLHKTKIHSLFNLCSCFYSFSFYAKHRDLGTISNKMEVFSKIRWIEIYWKTFNKLTFLSRKTQFEDIRIFIFYVKLFHILFIWHLVILELIYLSLDLNVYMTFVYRIIWIPNWLYR